MKTELLLSTALLLGAALPTFAAPLAVTTAVHTKPEASSPAISYLKAGTNPTPAPNAPANLPAGLVLTIPRDVPDPEVEIAKEEAMTGQYLDKTVAPKVEPVAPPVAPKSGGGKAWLWILLALAAGGGGYFWWRKRQAAPAAPPEA